MNNQGQFGGPKAVKNIQFKNAGLIQGINKLSDAVGSTLGAAGSSVVIEDDFGNAYVTKDGVTVSESILLLDPVENMGCTMLKQAASKTNSKAGDGTTTSTVLAQALVKSYTERITPSDSFRDIRKGIKTFEEYALKQLDKKSLKVDDKRLEQVSVVSCNNDKELGVLISNAFKNIGEHGVVTVEASQTGETYNDVVDGTKINSTSVSPHFYTDLERETCELDNPLVFLSVSEIPNSTKIRPIMEYAVSNNRSILLIAPCSDQIIQALAMNKVKGNIKVNIVQPPSFGQKRSDLLEDIALLVGGKVFDDSLGDSLDSISHTMLGSADKATSDGDGTVLTIKDKSTIVADKIVDLQTSLEETEHNVLKKHIEARLALLCGGVSVIYVGANTKVEQDEKKDRVVDAVHAVKAAKKEGILPGGGRALAHIAEFNNCKDSLGMLMLADAIKAPYVKILDNAGLNPNDYDISAWGEGVDVIDGEVKNMVKTGIIDPTLVTKEALKNAISVAITILSTSCVISNVRLDQ